MSVVRAFAAPKSHSRPFVSFGEQMRAIAMQESSKIQDRRLVRVAIGASEEDPSGGGFLVEEEFAQDLVESLYKEAVVAPLCDRRSIEKPADYTLPAITETSRADGSRSGGALAYWLAEGATIPTSFPKFSAIKFNPIKLAAACIVSSELASDAEAIEDRLTDIFASEMAFKLDAAVLNGTGTGTPLGITNGPALITVAKETGQASGTISGVNISSIGRVWPRHAARALCGSPVKMRSRRSKVTLLAGVLRVDFRGFLFPPGIAGNARPLLKGRPVIEVEQAPALGAPGDILLVDLTQYVIVSKPFVNAISVHVQFFSDQVVFRFVLRLDGKPKWVSPVTPFNSTSTRSPFVALAAR